MATAGDYIQPSMGAGYSDSVIVDDTVDANGFKHAAKIVQVGASGLPTGAATAAKQDTGNTSLATIATQTAPIVNFGAGEYETVAASQTAQVLGATGAAGDYIAGILVIPAVVACGLVTLLDGATSIPVFVGGGTTALPSCIPFFIPLGVKAVGAGWSITTGASVSCIASGNFT